MKSFTNFDDSITIVSESFIIFAEILKINKNDK